MYEDDKLYAYPLNSGRHDSGKDITLPRHHETPRGVWGNDTTIWVAEDGFTNDNKIHAYNRSDGSSDPSKDFTKLDAAGNQEVRGIWSNGATMWVADDDDDKLFAYQLTPGVGFGNREPGKDIALDDQNADPRGIWSDGTTMWVADEGDDKLYTYALPSIGGIASLAAESTGPTTATVTVELRMRDITAATLYLRHSLDGGATWGPTQQQAVSSADASVDLNLTGLTNGGHYTVQASLDSAFPPADTFVRSFTNRPEATFALDGTNRPVGLWMNSVTIWVADDDDDKIYAYQRSDGSRDPDKDFDNLEGAGNKALNGIWSDGRTMFVVDRSNFTLDGFDVNAYPPAQGVYAYKITPGSEFGARDTGKEFYLDAFNANPRGIWGDANTIWVTEDDSYFGNWIFAYQRPGSHSLRDPARDFTALADGDGDPRGLWSDGQTMWVADDRYNRVRAYGMSTRGRRASMDVVLSPGNGAPTEIWSDGEVLWVLDREDKLIYPYYLPQLPANNPAGGQPGIIGTAQVRRTVTADTSAITDADGISAGAAHTYQWIRVDGSTETAIAGATGSAYVITGDDLGLTLKVRVGFVDDLAYRETAVSEASAPVEATVNMPATGQPTIIGTAWVDLPLMADTSAIADGEGIPDGAINYQWIRVDGSTETAVAGATGSAYMLGAADAGRTIKVRVSFADGLGFQESVDSDETAPVLTRSDDGDGVWTATMTVGRGTSWRGYDEDEDGDVGSITNNRITTLDGVEHTLGTLIEYTGGHSADDLELVISPPLPGGFDLVMGASRFRSVHAHRQGTSIYRWLDMAPGWEIGASVVVTLVIDAPDTTPAPDNSPATGAPAITGRVYVGQRLRVDTSAIADANGIPEDAFSYQWVRADRSTETDIAGAAGSGYVITGADLGKTLKVRVGFTDGDGFGEGPLASAATAAVPTAPGFPIRGRGFALASANDFPRGVWANASTVWVSDSDGAESKIYAYGRDGDRESASDFDTLADAGNNTPRGIASDGETMFVMDGTDLKVYAYRMSDKSHDEDKDFDLDSSNDNPWGIWVNATTFWVTENDGAESKIYAYSRDGTPDPGGDFDTLVEAGNDDPRGIASDGKTMFVMDGTDLKVYAYRMSDKSRDPSKDFNLHANNGNPFGLAWGGFDVFPVVDALDGRVYIYTSVPGFGLPPSNEVAQGVWANASTVWVSDIVDRKIYAYRRGGTRDSGRDFDTLADAGNTYPLAIASDGETMFVVDGTDLKVYAYRMSDKQRDADKEFDLDSSNNDPVGIWVNATTVWVSDNDGGKIYAYSRDGSRVTGSDFDTLDDAGNDAPTGIASDGETMFVVDGTDRKVYAYRMSDKSRDPSKDFNLHANNGNPFGLAWGGFDVFLVVDALDGRVYIYTRLVAAVPNLTHTATLLPEVRHGETGAGAITLDWDAAAGSVDGYRITVIEDLPGTGRFPKSAHLRGRGRPNLLRLRALRPMGLLRLRWPPAPILSEVKWSSIRIRDSRAAGRNLRNLLCRTPIYAHTNPISWEWTNSATNGATSSGCGPSTRLTMATTRW